MWSYSAEQVLAVRRAQYPGSPVEYAGVQPARQVGINGGIGRSDLADASLLRSDQRVADDFNRRFHLQVPITVPEAHWLRVHYGFELDDSVQPVRGSLWDYALAKLRQYRAEYVPVDSAPRMFTPGVTRVPSERPRDDRVYNLTVDDIAVALGLSTKTIGRKLRNGDLPPCPHHEVIPGRGGLSRQRFDAIWVEEAREMATN
jgi:hypothetical protein